MEQLLTSLNANQRAAVTSPASVLQVLAPPGSGKTKTLTTRVAHLITHDGLDPRRIICCTFTIKATREMRERLRGLIGGERESKLVAGTFHSICRRYLVAYGHLIGIPKSFGVADSTDSLAIIKRLVKARDTTVDPKTARAMISSHKAKGKSLHDHGHQPPRNSVRDQEFLALFREYEEALAASQLLDFDDLLLRCVELLRKYPQCVSDVEALLIDEFQDTNVVQFELMTLLAAAKRRITIVGDPDQSIYGFRAAEVANLGRMTGVYPETVVINLEYNYRSASAVLKLAQAVIEEDTTRPAKMLKSTHRHGSRPVLRRLPNAQEESLWIASEIHRTTAMTGGLLLHSDFAILLRSAFLSLPIERALSHAGIPYRMVGGQRFFDRVEVRIIVDYLRTINHPDNDQALLAIINIPPRKVGDTTIAELLKFAKAHTLSVWATLQKVLAGHLVMEKRLTQPAERELGRLVAFIKMAISSLDATSSSTVPTRMIDRIVTGLDLEGYLKKKYKEDHEDRMDNVAELVSHASEFLFIDEDQLPEAPGMSQERLSDGQAVLAQFLANIVLSTDMERSDDAAANTPRVTISTIHSAKGLEWPVVFIPALYDGSIPHSRAEDTDEERRLLYVAMTRAQALLTMTLPLNSRDQTESTLSQFLPASVQRHTSPTGPVFDDLLLKDIASILHRPVPSAEDEQQSLQNIVPGASQFDDVWPTDGSRRPTTHGPNDVLPLSGADQSWSEASQIRPAQNYSSFVSPGPAGQTSTMSSGFGSKTTMEQSSAFSTANLTLGFTTASHQFKNVLSRPPAVPSSDSEPAQKKVKSLKARVGHGSITRFFSKNDSEPSMVEMHHSQTGSKKFYLSQKTAPKALVSPVRSREMAKELSSHRLDFRNAVVRKRPAPLDETNSNPRNRYTGLYSSPPPEQDLDVDEHGFHETHTADGHISRTRHADGKKWSHGPAENNQPNPQAESTIPKFGATLYQTSAASMARPGLTLGRPGTSAGKKTLGIRRTMNGWHERKHR